MALSYHFRELGPDHFTTSSTVNLLKQLLIMIKLWSLAVPFRTKVSSTKGSVDCSVVFFLFFFFSCLLLSIFCFGASFCFCGGGVEEVGNIFLFEVLASIPCKD